MSTELRNVPATDITQTRFFGGSDRGTSIQITQRRNASEGQRGPADEWFNHISLTKHQARQLAVELMLFAEGREVTDLKMEDASNENS